MGLYEQPNDYSCGPFALKHALVTLGQLADEDSISEVAHPHWWAGTDEVKLARAARAFDCDLPFIRRTDENRALSALTRYIDQRLPVILCVDQWGHWLTVVGHENDRFVVVDSKTTPVLKVMTWSSLRNRWGYSEYDEADNYYTYFDLHPLKPRFRANTKALFSVERARFLRRPENGDLAEHWDDYLGDLLEICKPRGRGTQYLSMAEFLRRHQRLLISRLTYWHGTISREQVSRILRNFRFVAETYALVIPSSSSRRALSDLSMLLALWAASGHGVGDMYGTLEA